MEESTSGKDASVGRIELESTASLQTRLEAALAPAQRKRVAVALSDGVRVRFGGVSSDIEPHEAGEWLFRSGCVTKLITARLVQAAVDGGKLAFADRISEIVEACTYDAPLAGVSVRHLLEHTHGLDDSAIGAAPLLQSGCIDVGTMLEWLPRHRRWPQGALYSYAEIGAWLAAAALERSEGAPYADIVHRHLSPQICENAESVLRPRPPVCASRGGTLTITLRSLLGILHSALADHTFWPAEYGNDEAVTVLPGWNVVERGVYFGWKYYEEGWFGQNSIFEDASLLVRVHPARQLALIIASRDHPAGLIAAKLFSGLLPELKNLEVPKPLNAERLSQLKLSRYCGKYTLAARKLLIEPSARGLEIVGDDCRIPLMAAENDVFFARPAKAGYPAYLQFVGSTAGGFRFAWDGQQLLDGPKCANGRRR